MLILVAFERGIDWSPLVWCCLLFFPCSKGRLSTKCHAYSSSPSFCVFFCLRRNSVNSVAAVRGQRPHCFLGWTFGCCCNGFLSSSEKPCNMSSTSRAKPCASSPESTEVINLISHHWARPCMLLFLFSVFMTDRDEREGEKTAKYVFASIGVDTALVGNNVCIAISTAEEPQVEI